MNSARTVSRLAWLSLLLALAGSSGCKCVGKSLRPIRPPSPHVARPCLAVPKGCRDHVHVFFLNGLDPWGVGNFEGLAAFVNGLGFKNTHYGELYDTEKFRKTIRRIHDADRQARFALVGFSFGSNQACTLANELRQDGIELDLLVYLSGDTLKNTPEYRPPNVRQVINIRSYGHRGLLFGLVWDGVELDGAENLRVTEVSHCGVPAWHETHEVLAQRLTEVASTVR